MRRFTQTFVIAALLIAAFAALARTRWDDEARRRKIDYIYMEAMRQQNLDSMTPTFHLLSRALQLDTTDTQIASDLAIYYVQLGGIGDNPFTNKGLAMLRRRFEDRPDDIQSSTIYANILTMLGKVDAAAQVWQSLDSLYPERKEIKYQYANSLLQSGDTASVLRATVVLHRLSEIFPGNNQIAGRLAAANLALGDTAAAIATVHQLIADAPLLASNYVLAGKLFSNLNQPDSVIKYYDMACAVDSTDGFAYYTRAEFYRQQSDTAAFVRETTHALLNTDLDVEAKSEILINFAREYFNDSTNISRADSLFQKVIDRYPHEYKFRTDYSSFLYARDRYAEAAEQAEYAVEIDPADPKYWGTLIILNSMADNYDRALDAAERAISYHPDDADLRQSYALALYGSGRIPKALEEMQTAANLTDDTSKLAQYYAFIGDLYQRVEQPDSAYQAYDRALEYAPDNIEAMNNYAYALAVNDSDLKRAEILSAETLRDDPANSTRLDTYAWVQFKLRNYQKAREYIDRAIENSEAENYDIYSHAGDIYFMLGEPDRALEFWQKALPLAEEEFQKSSVNGPTQAEIDLLRRKIEAKTYFYK